MTALALLPHALPTILSGCTVVGVILGWEECARGVVWCWQRFMRPEPAQAAEAMDG